MVVLTIGNAYLLCIADQARIDAAVAERANAKVSLDQATAAHDAGTSPKLDVLRARVDYQNADQQVIQTANGIGGIFFNGGGNAATATLATTA